MTPPTQSEIEELMQLAEKATPGPLRISPFEITTGSTARMIMGADDFSVAYIGERGVEENHANAELFASARTELPRLAQAYKEAMAWLEDTVRLAEHCDGVARLGIKLGKPKELLAAYHATPQENVK